jgi:hypothetical protein
MTLALTFALRWGRSAAAAVWLAALLTMPFPHEARAQCVLILPEQADEKAMTGGDNVGGAPNAAVMPVADKAIGTSPNKKALDSINPARLPGFGSAPYPVQPGSRAESSN